MCCQRFHLDVNELYFVIIVLTNKERPTELKERPKPCVLTLIKSMGVLTTSGSGSVWFTLNASCLLRPLRLDFFCVSLVWSCGSKKGVNMKSKFR